MLSSQLTLQPRVWLDLGKGSLGGWMLLEPWSRAHDISLRGDGSTFPSKTDIWVQAQNRLFGTRSAQGLLHTRLRGDYAERGAPTHATEAYVQVEADPAKPIVGGAWYRLRYTYGLSRRATRYSELELGRSVLLLPSGDVVITPTFRIGYSHSRVNPALVNPDVAVGITHWQSGFSVVNSQRCDRGAWTWFPDFSFIIHVPRTANGASAVSHAARGYALWDATWWPRHCSSRG